jgi:hypothetical protein
MSISTPNPARSRSGLSRTVGVAAAWEADLRSAGPDGLLLARYDRLKPSRVTEQLHQLSQAELASMEDYERSHEDRREVLERLRTLRAREPLPEYDALEPGESSTALQIVDLYMLTLVREYELKRSRRAEVLDELAWIRRERKTSSASSRR